METLRGKLGHLVPKGSQVICLDEKTKAKMDELHEWAHDMLISASEIDAERGMSAKAMGFDPYDIEHVPTGDKRKLLEEIEWALYGTPTLRTVDIKFDPNDPFQLVRGNLPDDKDLPF